MIQSITLQQSSFQKEICAHLLKSKKVISEKDVKVKEKICRL
jgi:hypothetical protein